jgi:hypothetical protein
MYLENEEVRKIYNFDARLEELILLEKPYKANVPMGRFDIFYYEKGKYKFDSGMIYTDLFAAIESIGDRVISISEAACGKIS